MKAFPSSNSVFRHLWLFGALALFALTGCALNGPGGGRERPEPDAVDIGYGTADKENLTGSVTTVHPDSQAVIDETTLVEMLAKVPGVFAVGLPGGGIRVRIRGSNSFLAGEEPLFLLDGMPVAAGGEGLAGISPTTIESITVLKDAGATAIYGSRGANGVILIKTKSGK